ncbi:MAG: hypothetical protein AAFV80_03590 [Bacteroidota bacterium]
MKNAYILICFSVFLLGFSQEATSLNPGNNSFLRGEFKQVLQEKFPISPDGQIDIESRYGQLQFETWDKNEVDIEVTINVKANNQATADEVFERISVDFSNSKTLVTATTEIAPQKKGWKFWGGNSDHEFKINYLIKMPASLDLDVTHAYGSVILPDVTGNADLELSYSEMATGSFGGNVDLNLRYSEARMASVKNLRADVRYSELKLDAANDLEIESGYSNVRVNSTNEVSVESSYDQYEFGQIARLVNEGRYDDFEIGAAADIVTESRYSNYLVDLLSNRAVFEMEHGSVNIKKLAQGFDAVVFKGRHAGIQIQPEDAASYSLEIDGRYTGVNVPNDLKTIHVFEDHNDYELKAIVGNDSKPTSRIVLDTDYGYIQIKD